MADITPQPQTNMTPVQAQPAETTPLPVIALVLGIIGVFTGGLFALAALIVGIIGRKKAKELGQPTGMATAGIVLGAIVLVISILMVVFLFVFNPDLVNQMFNLGSGLNK